jgi:DEAD/DEAH box helicase
MAAAGPPSLVGELEARGLVCCVCAFSSDPPQGDVVSLVCCENLACVDCLIRGSFADAGTFAGSGGDGMMFSLSRCPSCFKSRVSCVRLGHLKRLAEFVRLRVGGPSELGQPGYGVGFVSPPAAAKRAAPTTTAEFLVSPVKRPRVVDLTGETSAPVASSVDLTGNTVSSSAGESASASFWDVSESTQTQSRATVPSGEAPELEGRPLVSAQELSESVKENTVFGSRAQARRPVNPRRRRTLDLLPTLAAVATLTGDPSTARRTPVFAPPARDDPLFQNHRTRAMGQARGITHEPHRSFVSTSLPTAIWCRYIPPKSPVVVSIDAKEEPDMVPLRPELVSALKGVGVESLFSHQVEALEAIVADNRDVVLATPTGTGKSNCYNIPAFQQLLEDENATALYLFPLNVLCGDQLTKLEKLNGALPESLRLKICLQTGEKSTQDRFADFCSGTSPRILVTNPDTFHFQLARGLADSAWRPAFSQFLKGLRIIVLDEAHTFVDSPPPFFSLPDSLLTNCALSIVTQGSLGQM